jgi:hypothetical protein
MKKVIIILCFGITTAKAQQSSNTSGGNATGAGGTVSYSVGQMNYTTNTGTSGSVSQGVQQPFEIYAVTSVDDAKDLNINLSAFPNPTFDFLTLKIESAVSKNLSYLLFDINGKLLVTQKLDGTETKIAMNNYAAATYFIKITENNNILKTFKIIKN